MALWYEEMMGGLAPEDGLLHGPGVIDEVQDKMGIEVKEENMIA